MTKFGDLSRIVKVGWKGKGGRKLRTHPSASRGVGAEVKNRDSKPTRVGREKRPHRVDGMAEKAATWGGRNSGGGGGGRTEQRK